MTNCKLHSILVHDACGNFIETLTFNQIFSLECANANYKYASLEGKIFETAKYLVVSHKDPLGNNYKGKIDLR